MKKYRYLTMADRQELERRYLNEDRMQDIADDLGVHIATIYKELERGKTGKLNRNLRPEYSAAVAQLKVHEGRKRKGRKPGSMMEEAHE